MGQLRIIKEVDGRVVDTTYGCSCDRCGYTWVPRDRVSGAGAPVKPGEVERCPRCKSLKWNEPYGKAKVNGKEWTG